VAVTQARLRGLSASVAATLHLVSRTDASVSIAGNTNKKATGHDCARGRKGKLA